MKLFHIGDILSVTTERLVSPRHIDGVYDILQYLTGESVYTHQIPRVMRECRPWLLAQYPQFGDPEMEVLAVGELSLMLERASKADASNLILGWLSKQAARCTNGIMELPVEPMDRDMHTQIDPAEELGAMVGDQRIIVIGEP